MKHKIQSLKRLNSLLYTATTLVVLGIVFLISLLLIENSKIYIFAISLLLLTAVVLLILPVILSFKRLKIKLDHLLEETEDENSLDFLETGDLSEAVLGLLNHEKNRRTEDITKEYLLAEAELNALYGQINPHFLYNTLEAICSMALIQNAPDVAKMTQTLAMMFRNNMKNAGSLVTLREELESVVNYMTIQQFRFPNKFIFEMNIPEEDKEEILSCSIPHLTLQPIVENAIYHGLELKQGVGHINFVAEATNKRLVLQLRDDGCGIEEEALAKVNRTLNGTQNERRAKSHKGVALCNIHLRLQKIFGEKFGLYVMSTRGVGTAVQITLPLQN